MKKTVFRFVLLLSVAVLFSSCFFLIPITYKINFDQQSPADQNATVTFENSTTSGYFLFKEWNGININDTIYKKRMIKSNDNIVLTFPAGDTSFLFDMKYEFSNQYSSTTYKFEDYKLQYLFEPGKKYKIKGKYKSLALGFKGIEFYLQIYDTTKKSELLKEWMIGKK